MINRLMFRPNLVDCILEERIAPAIANLAQIILTTSGYTLVEAFPGANISAASTAVASSAPSVSGVATPTYMFITGSQGISSLRPGNITGVPSLATGAGAGAAGRAISIQVGSGADAAGGPTNGGATSNLVGCATVGDPTANPTMTIIGGVAERFELTGSAARTNLSRLRAGSGVGLAQHRASVRNGGTRDGHRSVRSQPAGRCPDPWPIQHEPHGGYGQPDSGRSSFP